MESPVAQDVCLTEYITFLSVLIHCLANENDLKPEYFESPHCEQIMKLKWSEQIPKILQKLTTGETKGQEEIPKETSNKRRLCILIPIGIPGMGKTFFLQSFEKTCKEAGCVLNIVSSDSVRKEVMDSLAARSKKLSKEELFDKSAKEARDLFFQRLTRLCKVADADKRFIFIDKNHPPNALNGTFRCIRESVPANVELKVVGVVPQCQSQYQADGHIYPFSMTFFLNCLDRVQNRTGHETLNADGARSAGILFKFLQMYKGVALSQKSLEIEGFDGLLTIPFTDQYIETVYNFDSDFKQLFKKILNQSKDNGTPDEDLVNEFLNRVKALNLKFPNPSPESLERAAKGAVDQILNLFSQGGAGQVEERKSDESPKPPTMKGNKPPLFLGIGVVGEKKSQIIEYIYQSLTSLAEHFPLSDDIQKNLQDLKSVFNFPNSHHITTLFLGGNPKKQKSEYYTKFRENLDMDICVNALVYVPDCIITGVCIQDQSVIPIENEFPHLTMMVGEFKPKDSNTVLTALFGEGGPLEDMYQAGFFTSDKELAECHSIEVVDGKYHDVYILKPKNVFKLQGRTKSFY
eukprot:TRINITY_DN3273_c0_g3_i3.p1 TRINITY_DN3273_c0_g3~~TRINITY_DN3273_c0_g3_i3.p1  ORF type:complete len:577 (-),score=151.28 TRINITY_DN3273_c0_g3_i3:584-2314(-)